MAEPIEKPLPEVPEPKASPLLVEAETTTRKPKGHRPKIEHKEPLTKKVNCSKCDKKVSLHSAKYTHDKFCKNKKRSSSSSILEQPSIPEVSEIPSLPEPTREKPLSLREKLNLKRKETAKKLASQMF